MFRSAGSALMAQRAPVLLGLRLPDFSLLTKRRLERGVFNSVDTLIEAIETWAEHCNDDPKPFVWTKAAEAVLAKARRARPALGTSATPSVTGRRDPRMRCRKALHQCSAHIRCVDRILR